MSDNPQKIYKKTKGDEVWTARWFSRRTDDNSQIIKQEKLNLDGLPYDLLEGILMALDPVSLVRLGSVNRWLFWAANYRLRVNVMDLMSTEHSEQISARNLFCFWPLCGDIEALAISLQEFIPAISDAQNCCDSQYQIENRIVRI